jgi:hypothetical protein
MHLEPLDGIVDIRRHARGALAAAGALEKRLVPLDDVAAALELNQKDLFELGADAPPNLKSAINKLSSKVLGLLAVKQKTIYVDPDLHPTRKRFTTAHELGHRVLPWQDAAFHADDQSTLAPTARDEFEREANAFAGELLFGAGRFNDEADSNAPGIAVPLALAELYGTSAAATLRQYAEQSGRPMALVAVSLFESAASTAPRLQIVTGQCVASQSFLRKYGSLNTVLPSSFGPEEPLFHVLRTLDSGVGAPTEVTLETSRGKTTFIADSFCNRRLRFVLLHRRSVTSGRERVLVDINGRSLTGG